MLQSRRFARTCWMLLLSASVACTNGVLNDPRGEDSFIDPRTGQLIACDASRYSDVKIEDVQSDFVDHVQPYITDSAQGCVTCHTTTSGRSFIATTEGAQTFYNSWVNSLLASTPGSLLSRLQSSSDSLRMPQGGHAWSVQQMAPLARVMCKLQGYAQAGNPLADEQFPTYLTLPYTGSAAPYYDNTFLNYAQLKGKVQSIFNDSWVRSGTDKFTANIGPLGGADFVSHFDEARSASSDFLLAMDQMGEDICGTAAANRTGPFAGLDTARNVFDEPASTTQTFQAESPDLVKQPATGAGQLITNPSGYQFYTNGTFAQTIPFAGQGQGSYTLTLHAKGSSAQDPDGTVHYAFVDVLIDGVTVKQSLEIASTSYADFSTTFTTTGGGHTVALVFTNDYPIISGSGDRNLYLDYFTVAGPAGSGTNGGDEAAARASIQTLYQRMLFHAAPAAEEDAALNLVRDLAKSGESQNGWSGLCEGLIKHPDFLFTLPPARGATTDAKLRSQLLLVKVAQDLLARPPTASELAEVTTGGKTMDQMVDQFLQTPEFKSYFFYQMRVRTQSDGTPDGDEPARMWTYLMLSGSPFQELLNGTYDVDANFQKAARDASHGASGVLTMKGYIAHKPGLPHYNYSARVLEDFLGYIFEVPPEVLAMRLGATASSTVDPNSICFACHQLLTPLATQRSSWDDNGNFLTADAQGKPIDDSDRNLVPSYPYKGKGIAAFSAQALKKERFVRQTLNAEYYLLFGRPLRYDTDERGVYQQLWNVAQSSHGDLRATLKTMINSAAYAGP